MWISLLALSICFFSLANDYRQARYVSSVNPFAWVLLLYIFYLVIPSVFTEEINHFYYWGITSDDIIYSRILVFIVALALSSLLFVFNSKAIKLELHEHKINPLFLIIIWFVFLVYLTWVLKQSLFNDFFETAFLYDAEAAKDPYKLKNIAYFLLSISIFLYFHYRKYLFFLPNLLIILIDLLHGSRTTAFICIIPILLCTIVSKKKLFFPQVLSLFLLFIVIGIIRSDNVVQDVPWYISSIGEFRETYITLPLYISDTDYIGSGDFFGYVGSLFFGIAQPLRAVIFDTYLLPGSFIAVDVGRGYGLGANFLIEPLYYGFWGFATSFTLLVLFIIVIYKLVNGLSLVNVVVLMSLFVVFLRLIVREGVPVNIGLFIFILIFYVFSISLLTRFKYDF